MQTSRDLKKKHPIRVNAVGVGVGLALVLVGGGVLVNCSAGVLEKCPTATEACICKNYGECKGGGGSGAGGAGGEMMGGEGGIDGEGGMAGGMPKCTLYDDDMDQIETKFIVPTCGKPLAPGQDPKELLPCHNTTFAPKMDVAGMIADDLVTPPAGTVRITCKATDKWINKDDWTKSYMVTKTNPALASGTGAVKCADGKNGMLRMPASIDATPSEPLTKEQYDCIRYYVYKLAGN
jgi:hypothetical protein